MSGGATARRERTRREPAPGDVPQPNTRHRRDRSEHEAAPRPADPSTVSRRRSGARPVVVLQHPAQPLSTADPCGRPGARRGIHTSTVKKSAAAVVFLGDESPMPAEQRVGCDQRVDLSESLASERLGFRGQATTLRVRDARPPWPELLPKDSVLLLELVDDVALLLIDPAGHGDDEELQRVRKLAHAGREYPACVQITRFLEAPPPMEVVGP